MVFRHQFICSDKEFTRCKIENLMTCDTPCGRGIFGRNLYDSGIHFTECGDKIKGFYISSSENEGRGSPDRVYFNGVFSQKGDKTFFEVFIYPNLSLLLAIAMLFLIFTSNIFGIPNIFGIIFESLVFSAFIIGYYFDVKKIVAEFRKIIR